MCVERKTRFELLVESKAFRKAKIVVPLVLAGCFAVLFVSDRTYLHEILVEYYARIWSNMFNNVLSQRSETVIDRWGAPVEVEDIRENEQVMYWNFYPIKVQLHLYRDRVLRIAYFAEEPSIRRDILEKVLENFGQEKDWRRVTRVVEGESRSVMINRTMPMTAFDDDNSVLVYAYILPNS